MIYVKVELTSRERKPKPIYMCGEDLGAVCEKLASRRTIRRQPVWHDIRIRTVSESEYVKETHPVLWRDL